MGSEDYYAHTRCYHNVTHTSCALDFRDGEEVASEYKGQYSAEIFSQKAVSLIEKQDHNKVTHLLFPRTQQAQVY